jgi:hypothetical protein
MRKRKGMLSLIASIGVGAAAYQLMKPNNRWGQAIRGRMNKMAEQKELFPEN